jgi:NAD(P)-dependent dehydrogenase (short-subunit alcohol dehydrogenase family)
VAIVTGAGSQDPGIGNGKAAAILFAREGASVLCVDQELGRAEETCCLITSEGGEAMAFAGDVSRNEQATPREVDRSGLSRRIFSSDAVALSLTLAA